MKTKIVFLVSVFCLMSLTTFAQKKHIKRNRGENRQTAMVGHITKQLDLSIEEAQKFWPVFNEMQSKKRELRQSLVAEIPDFKKLRDSGQKLSDADYQKLISKKLDLKIKEAELTKSYYEKFGKILPAEKVFKLDRMGMQANKKIADHRMGPKKHKAIKANKGNNKGKPAPKKGMHGEVKAKG